MSLFKSIIYGLIQFTFSLSVDDSSTSSEEPYENVAEIDQNYFARSEQSVHSSSDNDYDDVSNWWMLHSDQKQTHIKTVPWFWEKFRKVCNNIYLTS